MPILCCPKKWNISINSLSGALALSVKGAKILTISVCLRIGIFPSSSGAFGLSVKGAKILTISISSSDDFSFVELSNIIFLKSSWTAGLEKRGRSTKASFFKFNCRKEWQQFLYQNSSLIEYLWSSLFGSPLKDVQNFSNRIWDFEKFVWKKD